MISIMILDLDDNTIASLPSVCKDVGQRMSLASMDDIFIELISIVSI